MHDRPRARVRAAERPAPGVLLVLALLAAAIVVVLLIVPR
jgi:hypothetical protein